MNLYTMHELRYPPAFANTMGWVQSPHSAPSETEVGSAGEGCATGELRAATAGDTAAVDDPGVLGGDSGSSGVFRRRLERRPRPKPERVLFSRGSVMFSLGAAAPASVEPYQSRYYN